MIAFYKNLAKGKKNLDFINKSNLPSKKDCMKVFEFTYMIQCGFRHWCAHDVLSQCIHLQTRQQWVVSWAITLITLLFWLLSCVLFAVSLKHVFFLSNFFIAHISKKRVFYIKREIQWYKYANIWNVPFFPNFAIRFLFHYFNLI